MADRTGLPHLTPIHVIVTPTEVTFLHKDHEGAAGKIEGNLILEVVFRCAYPGSFRLWASLFS